MAKERDAYFAAIRSITISTRTPLDVLQPSQRSSMDYNCSLGTTPCWRDFRGLPSDGRGTSPTVCMPSASSNMVHRTPPLGILDFRALATSCILAPFTCSLAIDPFDLLYRWHCMILLKNTMSCFISTACCASSSACIGRNAKATPMRTYFPKIDGPRHVRHLLSYLRPLRRCTQAHVMWCAPTFPESHPVFGVLFFHSASDKRSFWAED